MSQDENQRLLRRTILLLDAYVAGLRKDADFHLDDGCPFQASDLWYLANDVQRARRTLDVVEQTGDLSYAIPEDV